VNEAAGQSGLRGSHQIKASSKTGGQSTQAHILCGDRRFSRRASLHVNAGILECVVRAVSKERIEVTK